MRSLVSVFGVASLVALLCPGVYADVEEYNFVKLRVGQQTGDGVTPGGPYQYEAFAQVFTSNFSDFTSVTLNGPTGSGVSTPLANVSSANDWEFYSPFGTQAALDAAYPAGEYMLDATGPLGTFSETVQMPATTFPDQPVFTGSVYSMLQGMNPSQDVPVTWAPPTGNLWILGVEEVNGPEVFFLSTLTGEPQGGTSASLPGGTLQPNTQYEAYLLVGNATQDVRDSFDTGQSIAAPGLASETRIAFETGDAIPEPTALAALAAALLALAARRGRG